MNELYQRLLADEGFEVRCISPLELIEKDAEDEPGYATGWCAEYILRKCIENYDVRGY